MDAALALACLQSVVLAGLGIMFVAAGITKLRGFGRWRDALAAYRLLPLASVAPVARALPVVEIGVGLALVAGFAIGAAMALLAMFAAGMAVNLMRGRRLLDCGCDPAARPQPIGWGLVARNLVLVALLAACLLPAPALPAALWLTTFAAAAMLWMIALALATLRSAAFPVAASGT